MVDLARLVVEVLGGSSSIDFITYEQAYGHAIEDMIHRRPMSAQDRFDFSPRHELVQTIIDIADGLSGRTRIGSHEHVHFRHHRSRMVIGVTPGRCS